MSVAAPSADCFESFLQTKHFASLDGLRALAVLAVVWHHTSGFHSGPLGRGALGVDLFFAISGFLITALLVRERRQHGRISLRRFYIRRTLRIFPLYYLVLGTYTILTLALRRNTPEGAEFFRNLPAFATYTTNWFVEWTEGRNVTFYFSWSLATEEQFYLVWPPLLVMWYAVCRRRATLAAVMTLAAMALVSVVTASRGVGPSGAHPLPWRIAAGIPVPIVTAAALALIVHRPRGHAALAPLLARRWSPALLGAACLGATLSDTPRQIVGVVMALLVTSCVLTGGARSRLLDIGPLVSIGTVSYGIYLMHMLVCNALRAVTRLPESPLFAVMVAAASWGVALGVYRWFEAPILRWKDRFSPDAHRLSGTAAMPPAGSGRSDAARPLREHASPSDPALSGDRLGLSRRRPLGPWSIRDSTRSSGRRGSGPSSHGNTESSPHRKIDSCAPPFSASPPSP